MKRIVAFALLIVIFIFAAPTVCAQSERSAESITKSIEKKA